MVCTVSASYEEMIEQLLGRCLTWLKLLRASDGYIVGEVDCCCHCSKAKCEMSLGGQLVDTWLVLQSIKLFELLAYSSDIILRY